MNTKRYLYFSLIYGLILIIQSLISSDIKRESGIDIGEDEKDTRQKIITMFDN